MQSHFCPGAYSSLIFPCLYFTYPEYKKNSVNKYLINDIDYINYQKKYQAVNADRLCERIKCTCGLFISRKNISTHKKTISHKKRVFTKTVPLLESKIVTPVLCT